MLGLFIVQDKSQDYSGIFICFSCYMHFLIHLYDSISLAQDNLHYQWFKMIQLIILDGNDIFIFVFNLLILFWDGYSISSKTIAKKCSNIFRVQMPLNLKRLISFWNIRFNAGRKVRYTSYQYLTTLNPSTICARTGLLWFYSF